MFLMLSVSLYIVDSCVDYTFISLVYLFYGISMFVI